MAKNKSQANAADANDTLNGGAGTDAVAKTGGKAIMLTLEDGTSIKRTDYIRKRFQEDKIARGQIAKEVSKLQGKEVPYQIVFAATKGLKGGPDKVEATNAAENVA